MSLCTFYTGMTLSLSCVSMSPSCFCLLSVTSLPLLSPDKVWRRAALPEGGAAEEEEEEEARLRVTFPLSLPRSVSAVTPEKIAC